MQTTVPARVVYVDLTFPILLGGVALLGLVVVAFVVVMVVSRRNSRNS